VSIVELDDVAFAYRRTQPVLANVSASFEAGEVHVITGPSGCGKSTLLYVIGLMLRPLSGSVRLFGDDLAGTTDSVRSAHRSRHVGFVFQDALLEPSMTVLDNVLEGVPLTSPVGRARPEAFEHLDRLGIAALADRAASRLSGGQAQRVALARALMKQPAVVLADEPTGNLDDVTASTVLEELFSYGRRSACTCIIVTHDERIARRADRVVRLKPVAGP
jgi:ABC-type lipoprotein export system ATPase subunit